MKLKTLHSNINKKKKEKRLVYFMMVHQKCTAQKTVMGSNTSEAFLMGVKQINTFILSVQPVSQSQLLSTRQSNQSSS